MTWIADTFDPATAPEPEPEERAPTAADRAKAARVLDEVRRRLGEDNLGLSASGVVTLDYDEAAHPRGPDGKFIETDTKETTTESGTAPALAPAPAPEHLNGLPESFAERGPALQQALADYKAANGDTQQQFDQIPGMPGGYSPERQALHEEAYRQQMEKYASAPHDGQAVIMSGMGGSGKGTLETGPLNGHLGITSEGRDITSHAVVDPDAFKEFLAERGAVPEIPGASPMETASLIHEESADMAREFYGRLVQENTNIIVDKTLGGNTAEHAAEKGRDLARDLANAGYTVRLANVSVTVDKALEHAQSRWERGVEKWRNGEGLGGRYVPPEVQKSSADGAVSRSINEDAFQALRNDPNIAGSALFDNMNGMKLVDCTGIVNC